MVFANEEHYKTRKEVVEDYPDAEKVVKVDGGWGVFDTLTEYETWKRQK